MSERTDLMEKRILIIDLDGTIIDSRERHISVMQDVLAGIKNNGFNGDEYMAYKSFGKSSRDYLEEVLRLDRDDAARAAAMWSAKIELSAYIHEDRLYEDALPFLNSVYPLSGIVFLTARSNDLGLNTELRALDLFPYPDVVIKADPMNALEEKLKAVEAIRKAYEKAEITIIGDTENEYELAQKTGLKAYILNRGFRCKEFWDARNVKSYGSLEEILKDKEAKV